MRSVTPYSKRIHAAIGRSKLSQREIAERAGVKRSYVAALATGGMEKPDPVKMTRVADVLGLDARELLALTDQLGAMETLPAPSGDLAAAILALAEAVKAQTDAMVAQHQQHDDWMRKLAAGLVGLRALEPAEASTSVPVPAER